VLCRSTHRARQRRRPIRWWQRAAARWLKFCCCRRARPYAGRSRSGRCRHHRPSSQTSAVLSPPPARALPVPVPDGEILRQSPIGGSGKSISGGRPASGGAALDGPRNGRIRLRRRTGKEAGFGRDRDARIAHGATSTVFITGE
jgi:hypothetical protein